MEDQQEQAWRTDKNKMKVSVVILNWNGRDMLRRFLPSVLRCSRGEGVEVCVADNGSTDTSAETVRREFPEARLLVLGENYGFAEGYNRALRHVDADYVVLLNSDVEVTPGWLRPLVAYLDAHPEAAACQPKVLSFHRRDSFEYAGAAGGFIDRYGYPFCRGRVMDTVEKDEGQYNAPCSLFWATGAALCIRKADYVAHGGLDDRFFAHMEEVDLCWRLRARGRQVVCLPESCVYHVGGGTLATDSPRKVFLNFRNSLAMLYKNLPPQELRPVLRARRWLDYLAAAVYVLKGQGRLAREVLRARRAFARMRPSLEPQRQENLRRMLPGAIAERAAFCLPWQYHGRGRRRFTDLFPPAAPRG